MASQPFDSGLPARLANRINPKVFARNRDAIQTRLEDAGRTADARHTYLNTIVESYLLKELKNG